MKKFSALFLLFLTLINFNACKNALTTDPAKVNNFPVTEIDIIYIDADNNPTEKRTDKILMRLKNDTTGLVMMSEKNANNKYTAYLIDTKNQTTMSFTYEDKSDFPSEISMLDKDGQYVSGYTTPHRKDKENFDIIWYMDSDTETFQNIPLKNDIYSHTKTQNIYSETDYQVKIMKISVRISYAINNYIESIADTNPKTRKSGAWNKFVNFFKKIFRPIVTAIAVVVAVIFPPLIPAMGAVIVAVNLAAEVLPKTEEIKQTTAEKPKPKKQILYIKNNGNIITNNKVFTLEYDPAIVNNEKSKITLSLEAHEAEIAKDIVIKIIMENGPPNSVPLINSYFIFKMKGKLEPVKNNNELGSIKFGEGTYSIIEIEKINNIPIYSKPIYLHLLIDNAVEVNGAINTDFKIEIK